MSTTSQSQQHKVPDNKNNNGSFTRTVHDNKHHPKNYIAERFQGSRRTQLLNTAERNFALGLMKRLPNDPTIVDVPCGTGRFTDIFSQGKQVYGFDISAEMLAVAEENFGNLENVQLQQCSVTELPLDDNSVDLAFCMRLLHHIGDTKDRLAIFNDLARVSRNLIAITFYRTESWRYLKRKYLKRKLSGCPTPTKTIINEAKQCGLHVVEIIKPRSFLESQTLVTFCKK